MMSVVFTSLALVMALFQAVPASKPDFSGTWTMDRSRSQSSESITLVIKHTATEVSIESNRAGTISTTNYPMEASPHAATATIAAGHSHAYWLGTELVTETSGEVKGQTVSFKQTRSLNGPGTEMTVESLTVVQHGYALKDGKNYSGAKDVYVRAK